MNQPTAEIYGVWVDNKFPITSTVRSRTTRPSSSPARRTRRRARTSGPAGLRDRADHAAPKDEDIVYGSCKGQYQVMNLRSGQSKNYWISAQSLYGIQAGT